MINKKGTYLSLNLIEYYAMSLDEKLEIMAGMKSFNSNQISMIIKRIKEKLGLNMRNPRNQNKVKDGKMYAINLYRHGTPYEPQLLSVITISYI